MKSISNIILINEKKNIDFIRGGLISEAVCFEACRSFLNREAVKGPHKQFLLRQKSICDLDIQLISLLDYKNKKGL